MAALIFHTMVRYPKESRLGDPNVAYEFCVKYRRRVESVASNDQWEWEADQAVSVFADNLREKYSWIGEVYLTGRSAGWLAIVDTKGNATLERIDAISRLVDKAWREFRAYMEETYPDKVRA